MLSRLEEWIDQTVFIEGTVVSINSGDGVMFLRLQKDETAEIVLFGQTPQVSEGDYVQIRGKVSDSKNTESIIGEELRVI